MTLRQLRYLLAVASAGTMSAAARQIGIAQPALSLQIARLEAELGQPLFLRHGRGMTLTDAGQQLKGRAIEILRQVDLASDELSSNAQSPAGTVAVGLATAVNMAFSVDLLVEVGRLLPRVKLQLVESMSGYLLEWVERGRIDLALVYNVPPHPALEFRSLAEEQLYLIADPESAAQLGPRTSFANLANLPLILPGIRHRLRELIQQGATANKVALTIKAEVDSTYSIKKLVSRGLGMSILSMHAVQEELDRGELCAVAIEHPAVTRSIDLVAYPPRRLAPAVLAVESVLVDIVARPAKRSV